jgi:general secretion pathway protein L
LMQDRKMVVSVIENLTRLLPDSAWLTDLRIDGDTVDISGFSKSAASLIPILETSSVFSEAAFTSAVTRDPSEAKERFSMKLRVRKQGGSSKVSPIDPDTEIR